MTVQEYADLIKSNLNTCQFLEEHPHFPSQLRVFTNPSSFIWQDKISLMDDLCLKIEDAAKFSDEGMTDRNFNYDLRHKTTRRLIWRICNHGVWLPVSEPCHVHVDPDDDDARLECFPDSRKTNFLYAMHCIKNYYEDKPQEWEVSR